MPTIPVVTTYTHPLTLTSMVAALSGVITKDSGDKRLSFVPCMCDREGEHFHITEGDDTIWVLVAP